MRRSTNSSGTTLTVYAFGLEEHVYSSSGSNQGNTYYYMLVGQLLGKSDGASTTFYQTDLQGSVVANWSNTAGSAALRGNQVYGPYGKQRYNQGTHGTPIGFTGQYADSVTGLDYYNTRYYDPVAGVFLSADIVQGNGAGIDPYSYVGGNPETLTDPSGQAIVGEGGQIYHPGSPFYIQGGETYSIQTGQFYNSNGFINGWRPGYGINAPAYVPIHLHFAPAAPPPQARPVPWKPILTFAKVGLGIGKSSVDAAVLHAKATAIADVFAAIDTYVPAIDDAATIARLTGLSQYPSAVFQSQLPGGMIEYEGVAEQRKIGCNTTGGQGAHAEPTRLACMKSNSCAHPPLSGSGYCCHAYRYGALCLDCSTAIVGTAPPDRQEGERCTILFSWSRWD